MALKRGPNALLAATVDPLVSKLRRALVQRQMDLSRQHCRVGHLLVPNRLRCLTTIRSLPQSMALVRDRELRRPPTPRDSLNRL